uniref:Uncharacterized protein n=1 Tax=Chinchilla lanigera TaxID=34839 RepID=A0A8C2W4K4_CHILA
MTVALCGSTEPCVHLLLPSICVVGTAQQIPGQGAGFFEFLTKEMVLSPD